MLFSNNSDNNVSVSIIINTQIVPSMVSASPSLPSPSLPASLETFLEQGLFFICKSSTFQPLTSYIHDVPVSGLPPDSLPPPPMETQRF